MAEFCWPRCVKNWIQREIFTGRNVQPRVRNNVAVLFEDVVQGAVSMFVACIRSGQNCLLCAVS